MQSFRETERKRWEDEASYHDLLAKAYRELAINYEDARHFQQTGRFNYRSLDVDRSKKGAGSMTRLLLSAHWALSGYWERPWRALGWLAAMWLSFALLYWLSGEAGARTSGVAVWQALAYSLGNLTLQGPDLDPGATGWLRLLMTLEAILGPVQIGFVALSLRRQFAR